MTNITFHIGFPKTGTSTLQIAFAANPGIAYLGKNFRDAPAGKQDLRIAPSKFLADMVYGSSDSEFQKALPDLHALIAEAAKGNRSVFISDEAFTFARFMPVRQRYDPAAIPDHAGMAARLHAIAPDARILMTLREQASFLTSWYLQQRKVGTFNRSLEEFLKSEPVVSGAHSLLNTLKYDVCYQAYSERFGAERVKVSLFEEAKNDFSSLIVAAAELCQVDPEEAIAIWGNSHVNTRTAVHPLVRQLGARLPEGVRKMVSTGPLSAAAAILPKAQSKAALDRKQHEFIRNFFASSNRRAAALTGLDFVRSGYCLQEASNAA